MPCSSSQMHIGRTSHLVSKEKSVGSATAISAEHTAILRSLETQWGNWKVWCCDARAEWLVEQQHILDELLFLEYSFKKSQKAIFYFRNYLRLLRDLSGFVEGLFLCSECRWHQQSNKRMRSNCYSFLTSPASARGTCVFIFNKPQTTSVKMSPLKKCHAFCRRELRLILIEQSEDIIWDALVEPLSICCFAFS